MRSVKKRAMQARPESGFCEPPRANCPSFSGSCERMTCIGPENEGQTQVVRSSFCLHSPCIGPENEGQTQGRYHKLHQKESCIGPENEGQTQVDQYPHDPDPCVGPENEGQAQDSCGNEKRTVVRRYTFKLYPNPAQEAALERQSVLLACLWNAALEQRETQWRHECQRKGKGERKGISKFDQSKELKFIRANDPEYAATSASSLELCIASLDDAFTAFYRRARGGAGKSAGYPQYKAPKPDDMDWRTYHHDTIWHRDHRKGWRLDQAGKHWRIYAKGIPGTIKMRGKFPVDLDRLELRDMRIMRRDNAWHCSIVVRLEPRLQAGQDKHEVTFDLIDEFATVKTAANGQCLPGWEGVVETPDEQISQNIQEANKASAAEASENEADDRDVKTFVVFKEAAEASENEADDRAADQAGPGLHAAEVSENEADDRVLHVYFRAGRAAEASETEADDRIRVSPSVDLTAAEASETEADDRMTDPVCCPATDAEASETEADDRITLRSRRCLVAVEAYESEASDKRQSRMDSRFKKGSWRWREERRILSRRQAKDARRRAYRLHGLTTDLVRRSSELLVICPAVREHTKSARGNERNHGAAVKTVAMLNRHVLGQAPATAIQMLEYKAAEAGIAFARIEPTEHALSIGRDLPEATKAARRARRIIKKG